MDYDRVSQEMRETIIRCRNEEWWLRERPNVEDLHTALNGDGELTLLVTLEYMWLRQQLQGVPAPLLDCVPV